MVKNLSKSLAKQVASLGIKKYRDETGLFVIEGEKFVNELSDGWKAAYYVVSESFRAREGVLVELEGKGRVYAADDALFGKLSDTVNPQGIMAVCEKRVFSPDDIEIANGFMVYCDGVRDPGNAGTLLRAADAAGAAGFALSEDSVDIFVPKALRACAGSVFHLPVVTDITRGELAGFCRANGVKLYAAAAEGKVSIYDLDMTDPCCIAVGNEARGLSEELRETADALAFVPMPGKAESLNVSVAGSLIIYEALRQRVFTK